ncbi:hypothetical protein H6G80_10370 [Nostoc sp. FACHB-87]|uniref:hypothetical protein n=1 Tax=Nostocaceae TaxID=1162 RepID=UPI001689B7AB|nr:MULTISPECIES: hypothetical protein [Nostocaceae]MBD2298713.1 hypothetical protein [Nostoc sp. FACHB-190]MBD2454483.1 hypothetical protein [Nostoc sp. FACHB-87]MBD2474331.1 hypothetical protein [Anabaena sp. FACHB-83]
MRKTTLFTLLFSSLLILPAMAQLGKVWTDFQYYSVDLQNYLRSNVNETFRPLDIRTQGALSNYSGELNLPDPVSAGKQVRSDIIINSISGRYENNSAVNGAGVSNEVNRVVTRGAVVGVLGREGQVRLKTKLEDTERSIETIAQTIEDADNFLDDLKDQVCKITGSAGAVNVANQSLCQSSIQQDTTVKILQEQAKINAENLAQTIQTNQSIQYTNLNLANISQQVEEANRARRVDSATEAARLLRTASQTDLFGREP